MIRGRFSIEATVGSFLSRNRLTSGDHKDHTAKSPKFDRSSSLKSRFLTYPFKTSIIFASNEASKASIEVTMAIAHGTISNYMVRPTTWGDTISSALNETSQEARMRAHAGLCVSVPVAARGYVANAIGGEL